MRRILSAFSALTLLAAPLPALAYSKNDAGLYVDDGGNVIEEDWGNIVPGVYIVNGVGYDITDADNGGGSSWAPAASDSSGAITVGSSDGAEDPTAGMIHNPDGSVTVESGQIQIEDSSSGGSGRLTQAEWAARWAKYTAANGSTTGMVYMDDAGEVIPCSIEDVGLGRSTILVDGVKMLVPTSSLRWDSDAPEDKLLAVVSPAKQSYLRIRSKKSQKSFVLDTCRKCTVLMVINTGKTWTMVDYNGELGRVRGYVLTSALTFYDNAPKDFAPGLITVKGKTPSGNTVHVRSSTAKGAPQLAEFPVGTPVTVFSRDEKWTEIDVAGLHCYILNEFVTIQEPVITAESAEAPPSAAD